MVTYKSLGIISVILLWSGLLFMIRKWPGKKSMSYSEHAAAQTASIIYYFVVFGTHLILFYIFASKWFVPNLQMPQIFTNLLLLGIIGEFIALLVPAVGGIWTKIHDTAAYVMLIMLIPLTLIVLGSQYVSTFARLLAFMSVTYMIFAGILFTFFSKTAKKYYLIHQSIYGLSFQLTILAATYIR